MAWLDRMRRLARANLFADDRPPGEADDALDRSVKDLERTFDAACEALAAYAAVFKRSEAEHEAMAGRAADALARAEAALRAGDEAAARRALGEKMNAEQRLAQGDAEVARGRATYGELQRELRALRARLEEARRRRAGLQARGRAADARRALGQEADRARDAVTQDEAMRRREHEVDAAEAAAEIEADLRGGAFSDDALDRVERERAVEDELAALRRRMAGDG